MLNLDVQLLCNRTPNTHLIKERLVLKDGHFEVEESRQVWELLARPSLEHAVEIRWPGGKIPKKKLKSVEVYVGNCWEQVGQ